MRIGKEGVETIVLRATVLAFRDATGFRPPGRVWSQPDSQYPSQPQLVEVYVFRGQPVTLRKGSLVYFLLTSDGYFEILQC